MKSDLSTYNNSWYNPGSKLKILVWYFINVAFFKSSFPISIIKVKLLRFFGAKIGEGVVIKSNVNIKYPWKLEVGNHCWIGEEVWIDNLGKVTLGNNVCLSQGAMLLSGNHNYKKSTFDLMVGDIILEDGVWIGAKAIVCGGATCFSHSMLSVASVSTKNLEAFSIYRGNPAKKVGDRKINA